MKKSMRGLLAAATVLCAAVLPASAAQAYEPWQDWNIYSVTGLDGYVTGPTPFTVQVDGPAPVCAMTYNTTLLSAAPWTFTYDPAAPSEWTGGGGEVTIEECSGAKDSAFVQGEVPFGFDGKITSGSGEGSFRSHTPAVRNRTDEVATVTVTDKAGKVVASGTAQPNDSFSFTLPNGKRTERYTVTASVPSGLSMSQDFTRAVGWTLMLGDVTVAPCSTVTWAYDDSKQPAKARTFKKDIEASLKMLSKESGLTFVETKDYANAQLRYDWANISSAGLGGTDGTVTISTTSYWPTDKYAGFKPFKPYTRGNARYTSGPSGRGWLIVHETMHALGFDHVDDQRSIMAPINRGQSRFTTGDLAGLHTMYRSACAA